MTKRQKNFIEKIRKVWSKIIYYPKIILFIILMLGTAGIHLIKLGFCRLFGLDDPSNPWEK